jgi:tetratricopeptide (TPR) repeat protein
VKDHNRLVEGEGVYAVGLQSHKLQYLFRQIKEHDKGIDAEIEITQPIHVKSSIIGIQVKARSQFKLTAKNTIVITVTEENLEYWRNYGRPVILIAYSPNDRLVWTRVDNASSKHIKIRLDQEFDESSLKNFTDIIHQYYMDLTRSIPLEKVSDVLIDINETVGSILEKNEAKIREANSLLIHRKYQDAARIYEALTILYEEATTISYNLGICLFGLHQFSRTLDIAKKIIEKKPDKWQAYNLASGCLVATNRYKEGEEFLSKGLKYWPKSSELWNMLGLLRYWQENNREAEEAFIKAILYEPNNSAYHFHKALCLTALKRYKDALDSYNTCIELNPNAYDAYNNKGLLLKYLFRFEEALEYFDRAIQIQPENPWAIGNSALLLKDFGYNERAIQRCQKAFELSANYRLCIDLASLYCRIGQYTTAAYYFDCVYLNLYQNRDRKNPARDLYIDGGFTVLFFIEIEVTENGIYIIEVHDQSDLALLNEPFFKWYAANAHLINLAPADIPSELFSPHMRNGGVPDALLYLDCDKFEQENIF